MSEETGRKKPKFAEAMTQIRHAGTAVHRLGAAAPLPSSSSEPETRVADPTGQRMGVLPTQAAQPLPLGKAARWPEVQPVTDPGAGISVDPSAILSDSTNPGAAEAAHGEIIVVFGCRGGAGATTVAVNLAAELAASPRGCVVVDLDLQMGDVLCALDLQPTATIAELLGEIDELDEASLRRRLTPHASGLFALSQGDRFDQLEQLRPDRIPALIAGLSRQFGTVIIDGLRDFSDLSISALDMADRVVLVVPEDVPGVKNASRCVELFRRLGYADRKISLVVNRHTGKAKVTPGAITATLKLAPLAVLAEDNKAAQHALDVGQPIKSQSPGSPLRKTLAALADRLRGGEGSFVEERRGLLGVLRSIFGGNG